MAYDIIDEWIQVQRKWMYLEGIFVGGDIRTQLPEEAKKFDDIDRTYRRVSFILIEILLLSTLISYFLMDLWTYIANRQAFKML